MENAGLPRTCASLSASLAGSAGTTSRYVRSQDTPAACEDNFKNSTRTIAVEPAKLKFECRTKTKARYSLGPTEGLQLVVLVPDDKRGAFGIGSNIVRVTESTGVIELLEDYSYTFWTTTVQSDGTHSEWRKGPDLPAWRDKLINITIEDPSFKYMENKKRYGAVFKINISGDINPCTHLYIMNTCDSDDLGSGYAKPFQPNIRSNQTTTTLNVTDLPIADNCSLHIFANGNPENHEILNYRTPLPGHTHIPEKVENVTLDVVATTAGWDITVSWGRPKRLPIQYNLTLRALDVVYRDVVSGLETSHTFLNVKGEEDAGFNVSIVSISPNGTAKTARLWHFPVFFSAPKDLIPPKECLMESCPEPEVEDRWELRSEQILLYEVIGEGAFGVVRRGALAPGTKNVAVKMLKGSDFPTTEELRSFRAEMELMKSVGVHPHIVSLVGCCSENRPMIVAEYCSRGDLLNFLRYSWDVMVSKRNAKYYNNNIESDYRNDLFKIYDSPYPPIVVNKMYDLNGISDSYLTPSDLLSFCRQIAMGMEFLASNRVVHRDLAARNVLVTADRTLKIADFGLSRDVYQENQYKQRGNGKMPVKWMALESLTHRIYTTQSDVVIRGSDVGGDDGRRGAVPRCGASRLPRLLRAGYRMPKPNNCSQQLYDVMLSCWSAKPRNRPTFSELHEKIDELLNRACAGEYLSLELDYEPPPTPKAQRYLRMLLGYEVEI
ncbi:hypothetical protein CASFOL_043000 [Castilleja foliolosa]|uniref:Protein kinase domain-containing protein n=1 Tax=Castilleja foliolosa TaxID=1961234 RepID=A0ABD3B733_9LAMI